MTSTLFDVNRLLKLRLVVARFGEMDLAKWWNTKGRLASPAMHRKNICGARMPGSSRITRRLGRDRCR
jgi:hypothetical protein